SSSSPPYVPAALPPPASPSFPTRRSSDLNMRIGGDAASPADGRRMCLCQLGGVIERALPRIACQFGEAAGFCFGGFQPSARKRQIQPTASTENLGQYPGAHGQAVSGADPSPARLRRHDPYIARGRELSTPADGGAVYDAYRAALTVDHE